MKCCAALILSVLFGFFVESFGETCSTSNNVRTCNLNYNVTSLRLVDNRVLAGSENALYSFGSNLDLHQIVELRSDNASIALCTALFLSNCASNYIKVIEPIPDTSKILVCGTHSGYPRCSLHEQNQLESFNTSPMETTGFSPERTNRNIFATVSGNQRFFGAISFQRLGMSPNPLQSNRSLGISVLSKRSDLKFDSATRFVGVHEHKEYIYFFVSEPAAPFDLETSTSTSDRPTYSKVIRICKSDNGIDSSTFSTLQKARIQCNNGDYVYNEITSTYVTQEDGEPVLFATFIAPRNGPTGSAICKYSFSSNMTGSLTNVFEDGKYFVQNSTTMAWEERTGPSVSCSNSRTKEEVEMYTFCFTSITVIPYEKELRPSAKVDGETLENIATEILTIDGMAHEILYYSNDHGQVKQRVANMQHVHMLLEGERGQNGYYETVEHIFVQQEASGYGSNIYVSRGTKVIQITRGRCETHTTCHACLQSGDPYCGWHGGSSSCINTVKEQNLTSVQSHSTQSSDITSKCGATKSTASPTLSFTMIQTKGATDPNMSFQGPITAGKSGSIESSLSIPALIGAAVGTFIIGIVLGLLVCALFLARTRIVAKRQVYQVQDKSKSNNDTIADTNNVTLKEVVTLSESKESNTTTQRYIDHTLPQKVPPQSRSQDTEVKTNIIEIEKVDLQNSIVVDASPVKIANGHVFGNNNASSQSSIISDTGGTADNSSSTTGVSDTTVATPMRKDDSIMTTSSSDNVATPNGSNTDVPSARNDISVATPISNAAIKINHMPPTPTTPKFLDSSQSYKASRPAPLTTSGQNGSIVSGSRAAPMTPGGRIAPMTPGGRIAPMTPGGRIPPMTPGARAPPMTPGRYTVGSSNTLPHHNRYANRKEPNRFNFSTDDPDDAFAETDTVPPLMNVSTKYGSLGRNKTNGVTGIARRQVPSYKVPKGRTDSTTWLRQESVSSDISPLQSPISDV